MRRLHVYLGEKQFDWLRARSDSDGLAVAEHLRRAIDFYIDRMAEPERKEPCVEPGGRRPG